jgi:hypothetical protein
MKKDEFLTIINKIFKSSNDYFGEIITDVKIRAYSENDICLWCQLDKGTTEAKLNPNGYVNFAQSGWREITTMTEQIKNWRELALLEPSKEFIIPFDI